MLTFLRVSTPVVLASVLTCQALGQIADITPKVAVISVDKTALRCNDSDRFYKVADLAAGTVVLVDGEGQGWSRVRYPGGLTAFVRAEDIKVAGEGATLSQPSRLKAVNLSAGYEGSFKALLTSPLPAGTAVKVVEPVKDATGVISGYRIAAPEVARGFVESRLLRAATDAEAQAFKAKMGIVAPSLTPTTTPAPAATAATPPTSPATASTSTPSAAGGTTPAATPGVALAATTTTGTTPPSGSTLVEPMQPGQGQPTTTPVPGEPTTTPTGTKTTPPAELVQKTELTGMVPGTPKIEPKPLPVPVQDRAIATAEKLEQTFRAVWRQPILESEFDELISEYDRAIEATPGDRPNLRAALQSRRQALEVRRQYRDTVRRQEEGRATLDRTKATADRTLEELAASRYYTIIGQVQPSLVYDGKQLPLMYRVVSVGGVTPRTLGYLRRSEKLNLDTMIGQVVGVIGEAELDRSLQLNIITPVQIDVLKYAPVQAPAPAPVTATPATWGTGDGK